MRSEQPTFFSILCLHSRLRSSEQFKYQSELLILTSMSEIVKIGKRYTIVIPKAFRQKLGLKEGQLSEIRLEEGKIIIAPKVSDPFRRLSELIGDVVYNEETEKRAEKWLLGEAQSR